MTHIANTFQSHYIDLIAGRTRMPRNDREKLIFQALMVFSMVTCMTTFNGFLHSGSSFIEDFAGTLYLYPITFCIAFALRRTVADAVTGAVIPRFIMPRFTGIARSAMISLANVLCMATIMCAVACLLRGHFDDFAITYLCLLPATWAMAFCVNFLIVGPFVKMLFGRLLESNDASVAPAAEAAAE